MTEPTADLRLAFRLLRRNRTLAVSVITTLALAIGAGVATFAIAEAALITPPPFPEPDRLAMLFTTHTEPARGTERYRWSYPRFRLLEKSLTTTSSIGDYGLASVNLAGQTDAEPISSEIVAGGYFATLGARPMNPGTASEVALAVRAKKPVILLRSDEITAKFFRSLDADFIRVAMSAGEAIEMLRGLLLSSSGPRQTV